MHYTEMNWAYWTWTYLYGAGHVWSGSLAEDQAMLNMGGEL